MAYADQEMSSRRILAIGFVALLHAGVGYALVTGLAYDAAKAVFDDTKLFDIVPEEPKPPEEPPPPPPKVDLPPPPKVTVPPPVVQSNIQTTNSAPVFTQSAVPAPPPPPRAEPPPPPKVAQKSMPRGNPASWVTTEDYPSSSIRNEEFGTTAFRIEIGTDGRATGCSITSSSGSSTLDDAACKNLMRRARFSPAKDENGNPLTSSYTSRIKWVLPK